MPDGRLLIIDYKSSAGTTSHWARNRILQAQLPLYAILMDENGMGEVSGITLAVVRSGDCAFQGITDEQQAIFDGIKSFGDRRNKFARSFENWPDIFEHWRDDIYLLAGEFVNGRCDNTIYDDKSLVYSGLDFLLRHEEGTAWALENENSAGGTT